MNDASEQNAVRAASIIAQVGAARSNYIQAIHLAQHGDFDQADALIEAGLERFREGHAVHAELLTDMAQGKTVVVDLLLAHAEDQLMGADQFRIVAKELIAVHQRLAVLEQSPGNR